MRFKKITLTPEQEKELKNFREFLGAEMSDNTLRIYSAYFKTMIKELRMTQEEESFQQFIYRFLNNHKGTPARAFMKNYLEFKGLYSLRLPKKVKTKKVRIKALVDKEDFKQILNWIEEHSENEGYKLAVQIIADGGLRAGECINLKTSDFDFNSWLERIQTKPNSSGVIKIMGKGNKERLVILSKLVMFEVFKYIKENELDNFEKLFKYGYKELNKKFKESQKELGFVTYINGEEKTKYTLHSLRHTKGSEWYDKTRDIIKVQHKLGHASITTTRQYIHPSKENFLKEWQEDVENTTE